MTASNAMPAAELRQSGKSKLEATLLEQIRTARMPEPTREHRFAQDIGRKWAFDFAWPERRLAVEVEGGTHRAGRHVRPTGFQADCEKYNTAGMMGWLVLRFTAEDVKEHRAVNTIQRALGLWAKG